MEFYELSCRVIGCAIEVNRMRNANNGMQADARTSRCDTGLEHPASPKGLARDVLDTAEG